MPVATKKVLVSELSEGDKLLLADQPREFLEALEHPSLERCVVRKVVRPWEEKTFLRLYTYDVGRHAAAFEQQASVLSTIEVQVTDEFVPNPVKEPLVDRLSRPEDVLLESDNTVVGCVGAFIGLAKYWVAASAFFAVVGIILYLLAYGELPW